MEINREELIRAATAAREFAYAPYSQYKVGAAVLGEDGKIYTGCNIENASYGLTVCAERNAIFKMVGEGCRKFVALAVVTASDAKDGAPCMACRQVMTEFCKDFDVPVIDSSCVYGTSWEHTIRELCPLPFVVFEKNADYHD